MIFRLIAIVAITFLFAGCDSGFEPANDEVVEIKKVMPPFPASIKGEVTFTWHIATDPSYEMIFLKEYGEMEFFMTSVQFDQIGINEESSYELIVEPMKTQEFGNKKESYRIMSGRKL